MQDHRKLQVSLRINAGAWENADMPENKCSSVGIE
jgi:hypothetical protein